MADALYSFSSLDAPWASPTKSPYGAASAKRDDTANEGDDSGPITATPVATDHAADGIHALDSVLSDPGDDDAVLTDAALTTAEPHSLSSADPFKERAMVTQSVRMMHGEHVHKLEALVRKVAALEGKVTRLEVSDDARGKQDEQFQETLAAQQLMLTQVCSSLQQLAARPVAPPAPPTASGAPAAVHFLTNQAGFGGALALRALRRLASEADLTAAVLSRKILLADAAPMPRAPGQPQRHLTLRQAGAALAYLAAIELAWHISANAATLLPKPLARLLHAVLRPAQTCIGYARWAAWLALSYLASRELQARCTALSGPPSVLVSFASIRAAVPAAPAAEARPATPTATDPPSPAASAARSAQGSPAPELAPPEVTADPSSLLHPPIMEASAGTRGAVSALQSDLSGRASTAWSTVSRWMHKQDG